MKYRHTKTGRIIDIPSELKSPDWEPMIEKKKAPSKKTTKKEG